MKLPVAFWRSPRFSSPMSRGVCEAHASAGLAFPSLWIELLWPVKLRAAIVRYFRPGPATPDPPRTFQASTATTKMLSATGTERFMEPPPTGPRSGRLVSPSPPILAVGWLVYMTVMETAYGASLGKFALGIRVVRLDGQPVDGFTSFLRNIIRAVDGAFFYLVGSIIVWNSPLKQRLGDKAAKTVVVPASS